MASLFLQTLGENLKYCLVEPVHRSHYPSNGLTVATVARRHSPLPRATCSEDRGRENLDAVGSFVSLASTTTISLRLPPCTRGPSAGWLTPHLASPPMRVATRAEPQPGSVVTGYTYGSSYTTGSAGRPFTPPHSVYPAPRCGRP